MNRIRELRKDGGYKQIDFCKMLGISQATLSGYETGRYQPDNEMLLKIASMFDVSIDYILGNSDIKKAPSLEAAGLSAEEAELLKLFRAAPEALQDAALRVLEANQRKE